MFANIKSLQNPVFVKSTPGIICISPVFYPGGCKLRGHEENRALNESYPKVLEDFKIMEKAPTRAFSWLKVSTRHYAKQTLTHSK